MNTNYSKPQVTIDLAEYLELKKKATANVEIDKLEVGQTVFVAHADSHIATRCGIQQREVTDSGVYYTLSNGTRIGIPHNTN